MSIDLVGKQRVRWAASMLFFFVTGPATLGQNIEPPYDQDYEVIDLGPVPGIPGNYGGVSILRGDANVLLVGGLANGPGAKTYSIRVTRDSNGHIDGFQGTAAEYSESAFIDGGLAFGPSSVLFYTRVSNELGQIMRGSTSTDKVIDLEALGFEYPPGGCQFVPAGFPGAGELKIASYGGATWYSASLVADGLGTFDIVNVSERVVLPRTAEGFGYPPVGSPQLADHGTVLITEYSRGKVSVYDIDQNGDPILGTDRTIVSGLNTPEGVTFDSLSGDMILSSFRGKRCYSVRGFAPLCNQDANWTNYGVGWAGTLGVPSFTCLSDPELGKNLGLSIGNSLGSTTTAVLMIGSQSTSIDMPLGGTLLVLPVGLFSITLPFPRLDINLDVPADETLCRVPVFAQVLELDAGASHGVSFTPGLNLVLGN